MSELTSKGAIKMKVLVIGVHIDDCESLGGTVKRLVDRGAEVTFLNIKPYMHYKGRNPEADAQSMKGAEILGAKKIILDYNDTKYYKTNEKTVRMTEQVIRDINPDILFIMHPKDNHIEHVECAKTAREAIFAAAVDGVIPNEIYSYECGPRQTMCYLKPDLYINVESVLDTVKKCDLVFNVNHADGEYIWKAKEKNYKFRGSECEFEYAEAFHIIKYPTKNNDFLLHKTLKDVFSWCGHGMYLNQSELFF